MQYTILWITRLYINYATIYELRDPIWNTRTLWITLSYEFRSPCELRDPMEIRDPWIRDSILITRPCELRTQYEYALLWIKFSYELRGPYDYATLWIMKPYIRIHSLHSSSAAALIRGKIVQSVAGRLAPDSGLISDLQTGFLQTIDPRIHPSRACSLAPCQCCK